MELSSEQIAVAGSATLEGTGSLVAMPATSEPLFFVVRAEARNVVVNLTTRTDDHANVGPVAYSASQEPEWDERRFANATLVSTAVAPISFAAVSPLTSDATFGLTTQLRLAQMEPVPSTESILLNGGGGPLEQANETQVARVGLPSLQIVGAQLDDELHITGSFQLLLYGASFLVDSVDGTETYQTGRQDSSGPVVGIRNVGTGRVTHVLATIEVHEGSVALATGLRPLQFNLQSATLAGRATLTMQRCFGEANGAADLTVAGKAVSASDANVRLELKPASNGKVIAVEGSITPAPGSDLRVGDWYWIPTPGVRASTVSWPFWSSGTALVLAGLAWPVRRAARTAFLMRRAQSEMEGGNFRQARSTATDILRLRPKAVAPLVLIACCLIREGRPKEAVRLLEGRRPTDRRGVGMAELVEGIARLWSGETLVGERQIRAALTSDPSLAAALAGFGVPLPADGGTSYA